jgi:hypothetical protein
LSCFCFTGIQHREKQFSFWVGCTSHSRSTKWPIFFCCSACSSLGTLRRTSSCT